MRSSVLKGRHVLHWPVEKPIAGLTPLVSDAFMLTSHNKAVSTQQEERSLHVRVCSIRGFIYKNLGLGTITCVIQSAHTRSLAVCDGGRSVYHHVHVLSCLPFLFLHWDSCRPQDLKAK